MTDILDIYNGIAIMLKDNFKDINRVNKVDETKARDSSFFYLQLVDSSLKKELNNRVNIDVKFQILYYSGKEEPNLDYAIMADKLYELFDYVNYRRAAYQFNYKVNERSFKVSKEGLEFSLEFLNISLVNETNNVYMKNLKEGVKVKHDEK